jgi:flavin-binding protein dodecin
MAKSKDIVFAAVGFGDLAVEKARKATGKIVKFNVADYRLPSLKIDAGKLRDFKVSELRGQLTDGLTDALDRSVKTYDKLVTRGEKTVQGITNSAPTKRAVAQSKTAKSQTKAAVTSIKKAADSTVEAAKEAVSSI